MLYLLPILSSLRLEFQKKIVISLKIVPKIKIFQKCFPVYCMQLANFQVFGVLIWQIM